MDGEEEERDGGGKEREWSEMRGENAREDCSSEEADPYAGFERGPVEMRVPWRFGIGGLDPA